MELRDMAHGGNRHSIDRPTDITCEHTYKFIYR